MSKRWRKTEQGFTYKERQRMRFLDNESWGRREHEGRSEARTGKLSTGQSVLHWWAGWFASATEPPMQLRKKLRPAWFDATIIMALGFRDVAYAGRQWREPCYQVGGWNGAREVVPEPFIRPAGDDPRVLRAPSLQVLLSHSMPLPRVLGAAEPFDWPMMSQPAPLVFEHLGDDALPSGDVAQRRC